jgi:hypothetical protein
MIIKRRLYILLDTEEPDECIVGVTTDQEAAVRHHGAGQGHNTYHSWDELEDGTFVNAPRGVGDV